MTQTHQTTGQNSHERGYRGVLLREETKERLRIARTNMSADRNFYLERRLVTVAVEMLLDILESDPSAINKLFNPVSSVVQREIASHSADQEMPAPQAMASA